MLLHWGELRTVHDPKNITRNCHDLRVLRDRVTELNQVDLMSKRCEALKCWAVSFSFSSCHSSKIKNLLKDKMYIRRVKQHT